jgi:hypothetical protein
MRPAMQHLSISAIRADALFVSALQRGDHPGAEDVRLAVAAAVEAFGQRGCAGREAQEFGDHPETAVIRMRWAAPWPVRRSRIRRRSPARARMPAGGWSSIRGCPLSRRLAMRAGP